jgi:hypothetical protein
VSGSLRSVAPADAEYVGVDFVQAKGGDVVIRSIDGPSNSRE